MSQVSNFSAVGAATGHEFSQSLVFPFLFALLNSWSHEIGMIANVQGRLDFYFYGSILSLLYFMNGLGNANKSNGILHKLGSYYLVIGNSGELFTAMISPLIPSIIILNTLYYSLLNKFVGFFYIWSVAIILLCICEISSKPCPFNATTLLVVDIFRGLKNTFLIKVFWIIFISVAFTSFSQMLFSRLVPSKEINWNLIHIAVFNFKIVFEQVL